MSSLARVMQLWAVMDVIHKDGFINYIDRWAYSWLNYSEELSDRDKLQVVLNLDQELTRRAAALEALYVDELSELESSSIKPAQDGSPPGET